MSIKSTSTQVANTVRRCVTVLRTIVRKVYLYGFIYGIFREHFRVKADIVMLESNLGVDFVGTPLALAECLLSREKYGRFDVVVVAGKQVEKRLALKYPERKIRAVRKSSLLYLYYLAVAGWLVNDVTFPLYFSRRSSQKYLNTWHGTPLKTLGRDVAQESFSHVLNVQRNFLHATHLLAPNAYTEDVILDSYMLRSVWSGSIVRCGYPRNDILFKSRKEKLPRDHVHVAFMPTWRGNLKSHKKASFRLLKELNATLDRLEESISSDMTIWVRLHPMVSGYISFSKYNRIKPFPVGVEPYEQLAQCHALITDYSSVMFDFATTLRPVILFTPDAGEYQAERRMYMALDSLPFARYCDDESLSHALSVTNLLAADCGPRYLEFVEKFCAWDGGGSAENVADAFFTGESRAEVVHYRCPGKKTKILFYPGSLVNNGIIRSFKTLIPMLDSERFDITILADTGGDCGEAEEYFRSIGPTVNWIPLKLCLYVSPVEFFKLLYVFIFERRWARRGVLLDIWRRESSRIFCCADFDVIVNYNGYSWRAAFLSLGNDSKVVTYVHNEMVSEVKSNRVAEPRLLRLSYEVSDVVALVRRGIEAQYCSSEYDYRHKVVYTPNPILPNVKEMAAKPFNDAFFDQSDEMLERAERFFSVEGRFTFVNMARFSPEKGQMRLIDAFENVWLEADNVQLFIIGGHGVLLKRLMDRRARSIARDSILIARGSGNPFPAVKLAHAFVFSSFYEGIGLVLFEAMQLDLPIVSTNIPGPRELLMNGYGLLVDDSTEGLAEGMRTAIAGNVPQKKYDFYANNAFAVRQFEECVNRAIAPKL